MKTVVFTGLLFLSFSSLASETQDNSKPVDKIPSKANLIVMASSKSAKSLYKMLKQRAVEKDFFIEFSDEDTKSFVTNFRDISKKTSLRLRVYVKKVNGGSNAIVRGDYLKVKKILKDIKIRSKEVVYKKGRSPAAEAWKKMYQFSSGSGHKFTCLKKDF